MLTALPKQAILGVEVTNASMEEILEYCMEFLTKERNALFIVTPNPEIIIKAEKDESFRKILNDAHLALPDGVGVLLAGYILGKPFKGRVTGTDFIEAVCKRVVNGGKRAVRKPITMGFLGAGPNVALDASKCLVQKYPGLNIVFVGEEWGQKGFDRAREYQVSSSKYQEKNENILNTKYKILNTDVIDILFVAFGAPKQEEWMATHIGKVPVRIMVGVGGAFDYLSGRVPRAPGIIRKIGLEWFYRLITQPWRAKRQLALVQFIWLIMLEKIRNPNIETRNKSK